jgi:hypothetical protein
MLTAHKSSRLLLPRSTHTHRQPQAEMVAVMRASSLLRLFLSSRRRVSFTTLAVLADHSGGRALVAKSFRPQVQHSYPHLLSALRLSSQALAIWRVAKEAKVVGPLVRPCQALVSPLQSLLPSAPRSLSAAQVTQQVVKVERGAEVKALLCQSLLAALSSLTQAAPHTVRAMWCQMESRLTALQETLVPSDLELSKLPPQLRVPSPMSRSSLALVALVGSSAPAAKALGLAARFLA